jgi:lysophospholipase L1-like esterase
MKIMYQYQDLHNEIRKINKMATIIFSGVIPMPGKQREGADTIIKQLNARMEKLAATKANTIFVNSASLFVTGKEVKHGVYQFDGVHLNFDGTRILNNWFGQIISKKHIEEKLGANRRLKLGLKNWWN